MGTIQGPDSSCASMRRFQLRFFGGAPSWRLNLVPCSSGLIGHIVSCKQRLVVSARHITIFFNDEGDAIEVRPSVGFLMEFQSETPRLLDW